MYIRKVTTRRTKDKIYHSYRLVESRRLPNGNVKQEVLLNLGTHYPFEEEERSLISKGVDDLLNGIVSLFPLPYAIEQEAQRLVSLIIKKHGKSIQNDAEIQPTYEYVNIHSLENSQIRSLGAELLVYETAKKLHLPEILVNAGFNQKQIEISLASILGRLLKPGSDTATARYLRDKSALDEVMGADFSTLHKNKLYDISDLLIKNKELIEENLYQKEKELFQFNEIVTLYDLTNTYFEGHSKNNDYAEFGYSKEKRSDCVLVTLALVLDSSGFPKKSHIFKGNVAEAGTLPQMLSMSSKEAIVVMDAGIATEENIQWLVNNNYKYLVISRKRNQKIPTNIDSVIVKEDKNNKVTSYLVNNESSAEAELYCHSEARENTADAMQSKLKKRFTDELQKLSDGLSKKGCLKQYKKVYEKLGRLKEKHRRVAHLYEITVTADGNNKNIIAIDWNEVHKPTKTPGVYCIRTNQKQLNNEQIWQTYRMLNDIESAFRTLKTELGMRPIYHQKTDRVSGHIFITILAYHILHTIRYQLKAQGIHDSWETIMDTLEGHYRITTSLQKSSGMVHIRKSTRPNLDQAKIYQACAIKSLTSKSVIMDY